MNKLKEQPFTLKFILKSSRSQKFYKIQSKLGVLNPLTTNVSHHIETV